MLAYTVRFEPRRVLRSPSAARVRARPGRNLARVTSAPTNEAAILEVRSLARELGLACTPEILADRSNLVLALAPHALVARVAMATSMVRVGMAWLAREVELARFLAARGGAVTEPAEAIDAGPHERGGLVISFWRREALLELADGGEAGARLAALHRSLRSYDRPLPQWGGWNEARAVVPRARGVFTDDERARFDAAWERAERIVEEAPARTASFQPVHGDAHLGNVLATPRGALWTDWEDAFVGPIEYDLACLRSRLELFGEDRAQIEAACRSYDHPFDEALLADLTLVRNLQVIPWLAVFAERDATLLPRMRARLAALPPR
jgi:hypothetical protein